MLYIKTSKISISTPTLLDVKATPILKINIKEYPNKLYIFILFIKKIIDNIPKTKTKAVWFGWYKFPENLWYWRGNPRKLTTIFNLKTWNNWVKNNKKAPKKKKPLRNNTIIFLSFLFSKLLPISEIKKHEKITANGKIKPSTYNILFNKGCIKRTKKTNNQIKFEK